MMANVCFYICVCLQGGEGIFDPQTEADRRAQYCIVASLVTRFPGITVIGEEVIVTHDAPCPLTSNPNPQLNKVVKQKNMLRNFFAKQKMNGEPVATTKLNRILAGNQIMLSSFFSA